MVDREREFRFYYFTSNYDATVAFYRDSLGFEIYRAWDRNPADRGTIFRSPNGNGFIEIEQGEDGSPVRGGVYIEIDDVDRWYLMILARNVPVARELADTSYHHRNFMLRDPNGLEISLFSYLRDRQI